MNRWVVGSMAVILSFAAVACGSDEKSKDSSSVGDKQQQVIDMTKQQVEGLGATVDEACLTTLGAQLSDDDAQKIIDAGEGGDPTLSAAGEKLGDQIATCISFGEEASGDSAAGDSAAGDSAAGGAGALDGTMAATIVNSIMTTIGASLNLDRACVEAAIGTLSVADLEGVAGGGDTSKLAEIGAKIAIDCAQNG